MNGGIGVEFSWLQSLAMGLFSGLTDVLPVSSQAHQTLLLKFFGVSRLDPVTGLAIRGAMLLTLLVMCRGQIARIRRQLKVVRLPRRRRNRPVDMAALMDARILKTALVPIVALMLLRGLTVSLGDSLPWIVAASLANALILYLPGLFPTADKDSRLVSPMESLQMGLGSGAVVLPGISSVGACYSMGILHGVDRGYMIHLAMMMHMMVSAGLMVCDALRLIPAGMPAVSGGAVLSWALAAAASAAGTALGFRILKAVASRKGLTGFSFYSFGLALFTFILYLMV